MSKYSNYIRREVESFSDAIIAEAMEYNRGSGTVPAYYVGTTRDTVKNIISVAACCVVAAAVIITFILMRQSITPPPADTTGDADVTESSAPVESETETETETKTETETETEMETEMETETETETEEDTESLDEYDSANGEYEYTVENGEVTITKYMGSEKEVTLPTEIDGYPVTKLGEEAFCGNGIVTAVTIEEGVKEIGKRAFADCAKLVSVKIPEGVTVIEEETFKGSFGFVYVSLPSTLKEIKRSAFADTHRITDTDDFLYFRSAKYNGTIRDWDKVTVGEDNAGLFAARMDFTSFPEGSEYEYALEGGGLTLTRYLGDDKKEIVVPSELEGYKVYRLDSWYGEKNPGSGDESIGDYSVFEGYSPEKITIPGTVIVLETSSLRNLKTLNRVELSEGLEIIEDLAFLNCSSLTEIVIPKTVTHIGGAAFENCSALKTVIIKSTGLKMGDSVFSACASLKEIDLSAVTELGNYVFTGCTSLAKIKMPENVTMIGEEVFEDTPWFESQPDGIIYIDNGVYTYKGDLPKNGKVTLDKSITKIYCSAFIGRKELEKIVLHDGVTHIGNGAFAGCSSLTLDELPESLSYLGDYAFNKCYSLTKTLTIPKSLKKLGLFAFGYCESIETVNIDSTMESLFFTSFMETNSLKTVNYNGTASMWSELLANSETNDLPYGEVPFTERATIVFLQAEAEFKYVIENGSVTVTGYIGDSDKITVPDTIGGYPVTKLGEEAFKNNTLLRWVELPGGITEIGDEAFYGCESLVRVTIPDTVKSIGKRAFAKSGIETVNVPEGVTVIEEGTFEGSEISTVHLPSTLKEIKASAFADTHHVTKTYVSDFYGYAYYNGTIRDWSKIVIGKDNAGILVANVIFSSFPEGSEYEYSLENGKITITRYLGDEREVTIPTKLEGVTVGKLYHREYSYTTESGVSAHDYVGVFYETETKSVTVPSGVKIDNRAFYRCNNIEKVTVSDGVTHIGCLAFAASSIKEIVIPDSVITIEESAFSSCKELERAIIGEGVTELKTNMFERCEKLRSVKLPGGITTIEGSVFRGLHFSCRYQYPEKC